MKNNRSMRLNSILTEYDAVIVDLDGTLYCGSEPIPGAEQVLARARAGGMAVRFLTNNSTRTPAEVCDRLGRFGITAVESEVYTSAQAAAKLASRQVPPASPTLAVGAGHLIDEVARAGLTPVSSARKAAVVIQGLSPGLAWRDLAEACVAVHGGAEWVACNADLSIPSERGTLPGNGSFVSVVHQVTGRIPQVAGKPSPQVFLDVAEQAGAGRPLVIGDRLDTDIAGATAAGIDSLLVLTGIATPSSLLSAKTSSRPRFVASSIATLLDDAMNLSIEPRPEWSIRVTEGEVHLRSRYGSAVEALPCLQALCAAWWETGDGLPTIETEGRRAEAVVRRLGLGSEPVRSVSA